MQFPAFENKMNSRVIILQWFSLCTLHVYLLKSAEINKYVIRFHRNNLVLNNNTRCTMLLMILSCDTVQILSLLTMYTLLRRSSLLFVKLADSTVTVNMLQTHERPQTSYLRYLPRPFRQTKNIPLDSPRWIDGEEDSGLTSWILRLRRVTWTTAEDSSLVRASKSPGDHCSDDSM